MKKRLLLTFLVLVGAIIYFRLGQTALTVYIAFVVAVPIAWLLMAGKAFFSSFKAALFD